MKRSEFFTEMRKGIFQTVKEIAVPSIKEDLDKVDLFADKLSGILWHNIGSVDSFLREGIHDVFVAGKPVVLVKGNELKAYEKLCPTCNMMMHWISYEKNLRCMNCEQSIELLNQEAGISLSHLPIKIVEGKLLLGIFPT